MRGYKDYYDGKYYGMGCIHFHECPICYKCMGPAGMYVRCDNCIAYKCNHTEKQREMMIKRENFAITIPKGVDPKIDEAFENLLKKARELEESRKESS